ncbi:unnamed protein product [Orchesella dallaii]|uniref:5'-nucleotidase domain-containing protein 3 n=1 Tax=Orchesella dallaii TaxID=48710 RepID=A0ABP1QCT9_9HEXA
MHKLNFKSSVVSIVSSHSRDGLASFTGLEVARSSGTVCLSHFPGGAFCIGRRHSTSSDAVTYDKTGAPVRGKNYNKFLNRKSLGNFRYSSQNDDNTVRSPPPIINNLPSRKPLHQSTDIQGSTKSLHPGSNNSGDLKSQLRKAYDDALHFCHSKKLPEDVDPSAVFACNRLNLRDIEVYGFDYDYTLVCYRKDLETLIYNLGREVLLDRFKYPEAIRKLEYDPGFAVRGLHYDIKKGLLLKVDCFMQVQLGSVYRGLSAVKDEEVLELYGSRKIPVTYIEPPHQYNTPNTESLNMAQLADLFSLPEMNLLCNVTEYLHQNGIDYHPESLFRDVKESVQSIHPVMHQIVSKNPEKYLEFDPFMREYLKTLRDNGKNVFLITNSPYNFVNKGLSYTVGEDWQNFFDVVVVAARKPHFFSSDSIPFRVYDPTLDARLWEKVTKMESGQIYYGGTLKQFQSLTGWKGDKVVYFGDHAYTDLADVTLHHGWRTGAIIKELEHEIETLNSPDFKSAMNWLQFLTSLLETYQDLEDPEAQQIIKEWWHERNLIRKKTKAIFNPQFGSLFRTHLNPTFFSKRLFRFADIYTSSVTNLMKYSTRHTFYPRRGESR